MSEHISATKLNITNFIVAKNPDADSKLPYLLYVPIERGLWLKAKETWPRSARVYCHPLDGGPPSDLEVVERVPVVHCARRGAAIDLVLDRGINKRSQFVFTTFRGRSMILWQTPRAAAAARPGVRVPRTVAAPSETIYVDSRERYGYRFAEHGVTCTKRALRAGDYAVAREGTIVAAVERKTLDDFAASLGNGSLAFAMAELSHIANAAVVVEGTYSSLLRHAYTQPGFLADVLARTQVRHPNVPIVFLESRKLAEEWTFRFLRAARNHDVEPALYSALVPKRRSQRKPRSEPS
jgi:ERCC4 domain